MNRTTYPFKRGHVLFLGVLAVLLGAVAFACGSDDGNGPAACDGTACTDGGGDDSTDAPATDGRSDALGVDGGRDADADAPLPLACGDGGEAGALDPTFGTNGVVVLKYDGSSASSIVLQGDGKTVLGGHLPPPVNKTFAVIRLLLDGTVDTAFGDGGVVQTTFAFGARGVTAVALDSTGRILAAGVAGASSTHVDFAVVRYTPDGSVDATFGDAGVALADFGAQNSDLASIAILPDGHILVSGNTGDPASVAGRDYALARFNANGSLDGTFGTNGTVTVDIRSSEDAPGVMVVQSDGKIVVAGGSTEEPARARSDLSAVRFKSDGSIDTTFGVNGQLVTSFGPGDLIARGITIDSAGRIVMAGTSSNAATGDDFALVRLTTGGALDTLLGGAGLVTTDFGANEGAGPIFVQTDGKLVAAGATVAADGKSSSIAIARYQQNGALDPTFGVGGKVVTSIAGYAFAPSSTAALGACGLTVAGGLPVPGTTWTGAARYDLY